MTEANAAADTAEVDKLDATTEDTGKAVETAVVEKAADTPADPSKPAGEAGKPEGDKPEAKDEFAWPDDWRERLAGEDEDTAKLLKRYGSPAGVAKALKEARALISSGKVQKPMPDASDEKAMAEWRKEQGIPDDPSGYVLPEPLTSRLVDDDKPILANFTAFAHKKNLPPSAVAAAAEWYIETQEFAAEQQAAVDKEAHAATEDALRKEWAHGEYKANTKLAHSFLESIPGLGTNFATARLIDETGKPGKMLVQDPAFIAWAADMGREKFGDTAFVSEESDKRHNDRKKEIEAVMKSDRVKYFKDGLDKEYLEILQREEKRRK